MVNQPKDYAEPTTSYDDGPDYLITIICCCIAFIAGFYLPAAAMISLAVAKLVEEGYV